MKKFFIIALSALLLCAGFGYRVYQVNTSKYVQYYPVRKDYEKGESIPLTNGHYYFTNRNWEGYSISVINGRIEKAEDFLKEYNAPEGFLKKNGLEPTHHFNYEYICVVTAELQYGGEDAVKQDSIDISEFHIVGPDFYYQPCVALYSLPDFNPALGTSHMFKIVSGKPFIVEIPYLISTNYETGMSLSYFQLANPQLIVTYYPEERCCTIF